MPQYKIGTLTWAGTIGDYVCREHPHAHVIRTRSETEDRPAEWTMFINGTPRGARSTMNAACKAFEARVFARPAGATKARTATKAAYDWATRNTGKLFFADEVKSPKTFTGFDAIKIKPKPKPKKETKTMKRTPIKYVIEGAPRNETNRFTSKKKAMKFARKVAHLQPDAKLTIFKAIKTVITRPRPLDIKPI